ncbi:cysteine desulfurase-like protein [Vibrio sp. TRT 21S02]|uniref:cysteine desulfurase-like protein n=1 Tax=Vibrio sp. TRT 21S02 TaxID=3418507 RepID=UPI003CE6882B
MNFTPNSVRAQFPALKQTHNHLPVIFLDGPGGSQVPESVLEAMTSYLGYYNSNLGGHFFSSRLTTELMQDARQYAATFVNAESPDNIVFGPNMTSLTFQLSRAISRDWNSADEIVVTALDHYSNVSSWQQAANDKSAKIRVAQVKESDCSLDVEHLLNLINTNTKLVAVTLASNTTGSIVDVERIIEAAHDVGAMVYLDAVHYAPHHLVDVQKLGCDFLVCSAYKFFGPHVGIAYVAPKWLQALRPYKVEPATEQGPGRFETGAQSFEGLAGVIAAIKYLAQWGKQDASLREKLVASYLDFSQHETALTDHFLSKLSELQGVHLWGRAQAHSELRTPTFALTFDEYSTAEIAKRLGERNICTWNGHFYALGLVRQLGLEESGGVLRIGFMHYNTLDEVDTLFDVMKEILNQK